MKKQLIEFYLDYSNNFLTISVMADYYDMEERDVKACIDMGRRLFKESPEGQPYKRRTA